MYPERFSRVPEIPCGFYGGFKYVSEQFQVFPGGFRRVPKGIQEELRGLSDDIRNISFGILLKPH